MLYTLYEERFGWMSEQHLQLFGTAPFRIPHSAAWSMEQIVLLHKDCGCRICEMKRRRVVLCSFAHCGGQQHVRQNEEDRTIDTHATQKLDEISARLRAVMNMLSHRMAQRQRSVVECESDNRGWQSGCTKHWRFMRRGAKVSIAPYVNVFP